MSDFKSPTHMAQTLCDWGMEPSTVHSMVTYQFGFAPALEKIQRYAAQAEARENRIKERHEKATPIGNSDEGHAKMMICANEIFVARLWHEIRGIQKRRGVVHG